MSKTFSQQQRMREKENVLMKLPTPKWSNLNIYQTFFISKLGAKDGKIRNVIELKRATTGPKEMKEKKNEK